MKGSLIIIKNSISNHTRRGKMETTINDLKTKFNKFKSTDKGKLYIIIGLVFFLLGVAWKFVLILSVIMLIGYFIYKKSIESKKVK